MAEPTRQALEQSIIKALEREDILIERRADKNYTATWMSTRGQDSATNPSLARVIEAAIRGQKADEYLRGQRELEQEISKELRTVYPLAIHITRSKAGGWRWEWWHGFGLGPDFPRVLKYALDYALRTLHRNLPESIPYERSTVVDSPYPLADPQECSAEEDCASG